MADPDSLSFKFWELVSEIGFIIVIIGVIGEGAELVVKWVTWKRCHKRFSKALRRVMFPTIRLLKRRSLPIETVFFTALVFGVSMEFYGSHKPMQIVDRQNTRLNKDADAS